MKLTGDDAHIEMILSEENFEIDKFINWYEENIDIWFTFCYVVKKGIK